METVRFSSDGNYLYSGGEEAVLVVWQISSGNKRFLPRLGAPIAEIAVDDRDCLYAISSKDNAVRIIDAASFRVMKTFQGLMIGSKFNKCSTAALEVDPSTNLVRFPSSLLHQLACFYFRW